MKKVFSIKNQEGIYEWEKIFHVGKTENAS